MNDIPSTIFAAAIILFLVGIFGFAFWQNKKRKEANWSGTVMDKAIQENVRTGSEEMNNRSGSSIGGIRFGSNQSGVAVTHDYSITVRPDGAGEPFEWPVSSGFYELVKIGDQVVKRPGTTTPEVVGHPTATAA